MIFLIRIKILLIYSQEEYKILLIFKGKIKIFLIFTGRIKYIAYI